MEKKILPAKIIRPVLSDVLLRERLLEEIDALRNRKTIWISAPGGAGKTTLVSSYVNEQSVPFLWYQIDRGDEDLATFFHYLGLAGKAAAPDRQKTLPQFTPEYVLGLEDFSRFFFSELLDMLQPETMLVFDNCQEIEDDSAVYRAILAGQTRLDAGWNIVFISRSDAPPLLSRQKANRERGDIGWEELRFTPDEFRELAVQYGLNPEKDRLNRMYALLDGWIAGLPLLSGADSLKKRGRDESVFYLEENSRSALFTYFAEEIFRHLGPESRDVLLKTCHLPFIDASLAQKVSGSDKAFGILNRLYHRNIFLSRRSEPQTVYQYHQLFREFLLDRCRSTYTADQFNKLRNTTAELLAAGGQIREAAALMIKAHNFQDLSVVIVANGAVMFRQGRFRTLMTWLQHIPEDMLQSQPWLLYWQGMCMMLQEPVMARHFFEQANEIFTRRNDREGLYTTMCGIGEALSYGLDSFRGLDDWIDKVEALEGSEKVSPSVEIEARITSIMMLALASRNPFHPRSSTWRKRAVQLLDHGREVGAEQKIQLLNHLIMYDIFTGNLAEASSFLQSFKSLARAPGVAPVSIITLRNCEALYSWRCGNVTECWQAVTAGLKLASETGIHVISDLLFVNGACGALIEGDIVSVNENLDRLEESFNDKPKYIRQLYHLLKGWKCLLEKTHATALAHAENALRYGEATGSLEAIPYSFLILAMILHAQERYEEAYMNLEQAFIRSGEGTLLQGEFACRLFLAEFLLSQGERQQGLKALEQALVLGRQKNYHCSILWRPDAMARLCHHALEAEVEVDYIKQLIQRRHLRAPSSRVMLENWPWPLQIYCLGRFDIIRRGKAVTIGGKAQRKPLALLKALISRGGRKVSIAVLTELLWPEADGDMQMQSFNTTLHRLRKFLDVENALILQAGELTLNNTCCWVDVWAFERLARDMEWRGEEDGTPAFDLRLAQKAAALYHGPFLASETSGWAVPCRRRLQKKFIRVVEMLGDSFFAENDWAMALEWYGKGRETAPWREYFFRRSILCQIKAGEHAGALRTYREYQQMLSAHQELVPSEKMKRLYRRINSEV